MLEVTIRATRAARGDPVSDADYAAVPSVEEV
jgi:hypothetical protein